MELKIELFIIQFEILKIELNAVLTFQYVEDQQLHFMFIQQGGRFSLVDITDQSENQTEDCKPYDKAAIFLAIHTSPNGQASMFIS